MAEREAHADVDPVRTKREMTMRKLIMTTLVAGMAAATSIPMSHAAGVGGVGVPSSSPTATITTTGTGNGGLGNEAGSIAAGANSALNPSGNTLIVPTPGEAVGVGATPRAPR
jgi:hypothetical protein